MDNTFEFEGRNAHHVESVSEIPADKLYEMRGELAKQLATKPRSEAVFEAAKYSYSELTLDCSLSDMWYYGMYMNYIDLFDGTGNSATQSWRAVSGRALELLLEWIYDTQTPSHISVRRVNREQRKLVESILGADWSKNVDGKLDLIIGVLHEDKWYLMGGIHVKPSFKGRLHHDTHISEKLIENGLYSPVVTLDMWSPDGEIRNTGQLAELDTSDSTPRGLVEKKGEFTNLYSLNNNTVDSNTDNVDSGYLVRDETVFIDDMVSFAKLFVERDDIEQFQLN